MLKFEDNQAVMNPNLVYFRCTSFVQCITLNQVDLIHIPESVWGEYPFYRFDF